MNIFIRIHLVLCNLGLNLIKFLNIRYFPRYFKNYIVFKKKAGAIPEKIFCLPVLGEHKNTSGNLVKHYFYQDLIVASHIFRKKPKKHVDVGSRIDGFVAHVASFRKVEVFDIRSNNFQFNNIIFKKKNINKFDKSLINYCDSLSCLHTLEHIGLGRYGDEIDVKGHIKALFNLSKMVKPNGNLYLSYPISNTSKIYFNSERIFDHQEILEWLNNRDLKLKLVNFDFINDNEKVYLNTNLENLSLKKIKYGCGIYTLKKIS